MAVLIAKASGNFTDSTSWGVVDATSYLNAENGTESLLTTAYSGTRSSAFTPGAIEIDGIAVKLCERIGTTGTISVQLELDAGDIAVAGTEVTINVADLPSALETDLNGGWIFFKFAAPVLLLAATAYQVAAKTSSATQVDLWCDGTADNLARALRTTTEAAPGAGDDMIITGEKTGAGAETAITITMNETATTDYGAASTSLVTPAMAICDGGILRYGTTAATNYYLKLSGHCIVYSGGQLDIGTTGTPIPRDSTAVLEFDPAADGDMGLTIRNLGTLNSQGLSRTSGKNIIACKLNTDEAANSTSLGVDTDTGWLDNDIIGIASTTRTTTQAEKGTLNGNAGASSLTVDGFAGAGGGLANAHSGTSPTQAEVILLTRNVKIRSATSTLMTYLNIKPTATVDIDWTEFRYIGENATGKRGIEIETTTGDCNIQYSSLYDCEDQGIFITGSTTNNITFSNNCLFNINSAAASNGNAIAIAATTGTSIVISGNFVILTTGLGGADGYEIGDHGITLTNNVAASIGGNGFDFTETNGNSGTIDGNIAHSTSGACFNFAVDVGIFTISNITAWRSNSAAGGGISINMGIANATKMVIDTGTLFGNNTQNLSLAGPIGDLTLLNITSSGDTTFSTTSGILLNFSPRIYIIKMVSCDFSTVTGIKTAHTQDISIPAGGRGSLLMVEANNCKFGAATEFNGFPSNVRTGSYIKSQKHDQTAGNHKTLLKYGNIDIETTAGLYRTASPSVRITPNNASNKVESGSFKVNVNSGQTCTPSVYVRESVVGDGTDYNGNRPRLILKRNDAIGITADTVIDTATASAEGAFEQLTGTTSAASDDGVMEFIVDCDGTTGWVNVDDFSATVA